MELVCPAGNLPMLKAAVDQGANAVYIGFRDDTNARHFAGLNFNDKQIREGLNYAHDRKVKVFVAINTYAQPNGWERWTAAVDRAADLGVDAIILADMGVLDYAAERYPNVNLHLSVQGSATNPAAIRFMHRHFGIKRVVVPRVLSLAQVAHLIQEAPVPVEIFGFGSLCVMVEGRCLLSSYACGQSPNTYGACSPAAHVEWRDTAQGQETRLGGVLIERRSRDEPAGYPTLCKGRYDVAGELRHAIEEPTSLNTLDILPGILAAGVSAIKIEGRQRSTRYVSQVTQVWREAIDACQRNPEAFRPRESWHQILAQVSEGAQTTIGPYHRPWH
ncbi:ubiquinone anaerobic biosynthesis protein UbiU [Thiocystis violascens]|uniref:Ubiquinone biosynthesis protein UbiU n=1 Tax=Thiocystis violascens (strain ATCC 17096 / DSM 198 / 6111) TaxID=765911 RepID=I3Y8G7_THIV6|nr:peptidase U32 family protein [Thiocystis violascens]AFL73285.1 collagenase-like protease [Thiocystis violascens DSM 198]